MNFNYVNAPAGSGKTTAIINQILQAPSDTNIIFASPTHILNEEVYKALKLLALPQQVIHLVPDSRQSISTQFFGSVYKKNIGSQGKIIIMSHAALALISRVFEDKEDWSLVIDEVEAAVDIYTYHIPLSIHELAQYVKATPVKGAPKARELCLRNVNRARAFIDSQPDSSQAEVRNIINHLLQGDMINVPDERWVKLCSNDFSDTSSNEDNPYVNIFGGYTDSQSNTLPAIIYRNPHKYSAYKTRTILSANFTDTLTYYVWKNVFKVTFNSIDIPLQFTEHTDTNIEIYSANREEASVTLATHGRKATSSKGKYISALEGKRAFAKAINGDAFIYTLNKSLDTQDNDGLGIRISTYAFGLNKYQHISNIWLGAVMNVDNEIYALFEAKGLSPDKVRKYLNQQLLYQAACRLGGIRGGKYHGNKVTIGVLCDQHAIWLGKYFPNCVVRNLNEDGTLDSGIKVCSVIRRMDRAAVREEEEKEVAGAEEKRQTAKECMAEALYHKATTDSTVIRIKDDSESHVVVWNSVNEFKDIYCKKPINTLNQQVSSFKFMKLLRDCVHINKVKSKDDNTAFMGNHLKEVNGILGRKKENVAYTTMLVFDVDDGDIDIKDMKAYFHKRRLASVLYTSWSASAEKPNRYRVVVMADRAMNQDEHEAIYRHLIKDINSWFKCYTPTCAADKERILKDNPDALFSGIDTSKINLSSMFYLPAQNPEHRDAYQVYLNYGQNSICVNKNLLKVDAYLLSGGYLSEEDESVELANMSGNTQPIFNGSDDVLVSKEEMLAELSKGHIYLGNHLDFGRAVCALKHGGCSVDEIEPILSKISRSKTRADLEYAYKSFTKVPYSWICKVVSLACLNAI